MGVGHRSTVVPPCGMDVPCCRGRITFPSHPKIHPHAHEAIHSRRQLDVHAVGKPRASARAALRQRTGGDARNVDHQGHVGCACEKVVPAQPATANGPRRTTSRNAQSRPGFALRFRRATQCARPCARLAHARHGHVLCPIAALPERKPVVRKKEQNRVVRIPAAQCTCHRQRKCGGGGGTGDAICACACGAGGGGGGGACVGCVCVCVRLCAFVC